MLDCLILGDSLAVGVGQAHPGCETAARVGITSGAYLRTLFAAAHKAAGSVVISLGVNDDPSMATVENLRRMRAQLQAREVTWLLPGIKEEVRRAILAVAAEYRDRTVDTRAETGPDHLHPTAAGYRLIAAWTLGGDPGQHWPVALHPSPAPLNPPQWLPMVQVPTAHPSLQPGFPFRLWVPTYAAFPRMPAFRNYPTVVTRTTPGY